MFTAGILASGSHSSGGGGFRIPFKNSVKFPKNMRPEHLQDDEIFDSLSLEAVTNQMALWSQTRATQEATEVKKKRSEKIGNKSNTAIKPVTILEGKDDATTLFHPQRYSLRPPVTGQHKVWDQYPTHWPEIYFSVNLSDVGLENDLGQKQLELLHDRRSDIRINMFAPSNANVGRSGFRTTNVKACENGSTDVVSKDEWNRCLTVNDLMMSLDNLVAGWACFWEGDRSMVTLRRVVTKMKEFVGIANQNTRLKALENFINKVLEINQRKAIQRDLPLTYKEVMDIAKEYVDNATEQGPVRENKFVHGGARGNGGGYGGGNGRGYGGAQGSGGGFGRRFMKDGKESSLETATRRLLEGHKHRGMDYCVNFNLKDNMGQPKCKNRNCPRAHVCGFIPRGEDRPCAKAHSKFEHHHKN